MKLSFSAKSKYATCGHMYKLHYVDRLRSLHTSAHLLFGNMIDGALNALLVGEDWLKVVDTEAARMKNRIDIRYSRVDCDYDKELMNALPLLPANSPSEEALALNNRFVEKLKAKAIILVEEYKVRILPSIISVKSVQKAVTINRQGYSIAGVLDAVLEWEDGKTYLVDHKTSSSPYATDSVHLSEQLATYSLQEGIEDAKFIVLLKNFRKVKVCPVCGEKPSLYYQQCPKVTDGKRCSGKLETELMPEIQVVDGKIGVSAQKEVEDSYDQVAAGVAAGIFPKNLSACANQYGKPCEFFNLCKNKSAEGLYTAIPDKNGKR